MMLLTPVISYASNDHFNSNGQRTAQNEFSNISVQLGFENEASLERVNYPFYIRLEGENWRVYNEQFRQLGLLADLWDQARLGQVQLEAPRNVRLLGEESTAFSRQVRIIRTGWNEVGEKCGYKKNGAPHSGCSFNKRLPKCTIVVPRQALYKNGDINEYHQLLGHEMWHCLVGSFH